LQCVLDERRRFVELLAQHWQAGELLILVELLEQLAEERVHAAGADWRTRRLRGLAEGLQATALGSKLTFEPRALSARGEPDTSLQRANLPLQQFAPLVYRQLRRSC